MFDTNDYTHNTKGNTSIQGFKLFIIGLCGGAFSASLGVGGAAIVIPALLFFCKYRSAIAVGTSLAAIMPATAVGFLSHLYIAPSRLHFSLAIYTFLWAAAGTFIGAYVTKKMSSRTLTLLFGGLLFLVGLQILGVVRLPINPISQSDFALFFGVIGFLAGVSSSLFGIGGGAILMPALILGAGFGEHEAIVTSLAIIAPTTAVGFLQHRKLGNVATSDLPWLIPASFVGAVSGAFLANNLPEDALRILFAAFIIACALKIFYEQIKSITLFTKSRDKQTGVALQSIAPTDSS